MATIEFEEVTKQYSPQVTAVKNLTLTIKDGEFMVLVGPSGCGKTTSLRMLAGLEDVTHGNIKIDGRIVNALPPKDRDLAMVFQSYALYPHMTAYDNIAFGLRMHKVPKHEIDHQVKEVAKMLGIDKLLDRKPKALSGGERQRVALARAIVRHPKAFLLDEPLSNLDAKVRVQTRIELKRLHSQLNSTFVYVTHDQVEAMTMGDRIAVMNNGQLEQVATPDDLYNYPATVFVAGFIGSPPMNLIKAEVADGNTAVAGNLRFLLPFTPKVKNIIVGVRPESFEISHPEETTEPDLMQYKMQIEVIEKLGAEQIVYGSILGHPITVRVSANDSVTPGSVAQLLLKPASLHIFDAATGKRLAA